MKPVNPLLCALVLLLSFHLAPAQLSTHSRLLSGGMSVAGISGDLNLYVAPYMQDFLDPHFSLGGQLLLAGTFQGGVQQVLVTPEIRYYFNPQHEKRNWFVLVGSRFEVFNKDGSSAELPFQLKTDLGLDLFLGEGLVWESKLLSTFQRQGGGAFFHDPEWRWENNLIYYLDAQRSHDGESIIPAIGLGNWMIGGSTAGMQLTTMPAVRNFALYISPKLGYFLTNRLLAGLGLSFGFSSLKTDFTLQEQNFGSESISWGFTPFIRYYPGKMQNRIQPFAELGLNGAYGETNFKPFNTGPPESRNFRNTSAFLNGGVDIFLSRNVALEAALSLVEDLKRKRTNVGLQLGFQFFLSRTQ